MINRLLAGTVVSAGLLAGPAPALAGTLAVTDPAGGTRDFGIVSVSAGPSFATATIENTGSNTTVSGVTVGGAAPASFTASIPGLPIVLGNTDSLTVNLSFDPTSRDAQSATAIIANNGTPSPLNIGLAGDGAAPELTLTPVAKDFGSQLLGGSSAAQVFTAENIGEETANVGTVAIVGADAGSFQTSADGCSLAPVPAAGGTCTVSAAFAPTAAGTKAATLQIPSNALGGPDTATLTGTATAPTAVPPQPPQPPTRKCKKGRKLKKGKCVKGKRKRR